MLNISVIALFPEMVESVVRYGVISRALQKGLVALHTLNPRDFSDHANRRVDDRPYGGGAGMVMQVAPLHAAVSKARTLGQGKTRTIYLSPQGKPLTQHVVSQLLDYDHLILVAGRYEGVDERFLTHNVDEEISIGDYVLSGGELAAMVLIDALIRLLPGALGSAESAISDSFSQGLLEYPQYTRPEEIDGERVPDVLLSGDHEAIRRWRLMHALGRTWQRRPDLLCDMVLSEEMQNALADYRQEHCEKNEFSTAAGVEKKK